MSFRREKFVPQGGPDGGDGGKGGDGILRGSEGEHLLRAFQFKRMFEAEDGGKGLGKKKSGRGAKDLVVNVPVGTLVWKVRDDGSKELLGDLVDDGCRMVVARGGRGGRGNTHFTFSENRVPLLAEGGEFGEEVELELEVKLLADIGIVGLPSVGKSSLLRACSRARPDVAAYPFTTLEPVLGLVERKRRVFVAVEIPGLIEGAHGGAGLGDEFLRHMGRTRGIIHLLDGSSADVVKDYRQVREEMRLYDEALLEKPEVVVINKIDLPEVRERLSTLRETLQKNGLRGLFISALTGEEVEDVLDRASDIVDEQRSKMKVPSETMPALHPRSREGKPSVRREGEVFVLSSPHAERLVRRVDLGDERVQAQLWREFQRTGVVRALERAGAKSGMMVRIGNYELEWK
ncbi:MAG: GTPase Obg [Dehalococcoidia bacterium]|nr:GTPase Obg [Dehalococcoidia bacterium]